MRKHGFWYWLREILMGIGLAVIAILLLAVALYVGLEVGHPAVVIGLPILSVVMAMLLAQSASTSRDESQGEPFGSPPRTQWKLCDPNLLNGGVWRARLDPRSPDFPVIGDPDQTLRAVTRLVSDWSFRSGYPYLGYCRVARVVPIHPETAGSVGASDEHRRTYRVTLALGEWRECAWLRIGDGVAEFQLESPPWPALDRKTDDSTALDHGTVSQPADRLATARNEPMWDRLLDG